MMYRQPGFSAFEKSVAVNYNFQFESTYLRVNGVQ